jgi:lactoylglutathione lyase
VFQKIAFIHYCTENLERAIRFYRDILGLQVLVQNEEWIEFAIGDQRLALRQVNSMPPNPEGPNPNGAMVWMLAQPIEKSISQLKENNINIINELSVFSYGKTATFADPDGNLLGLYEPPSKK